MQRSKVNATCEQIIRQICNTEKGIVYQVNETELKKAIKIVRGLDPRTFTNWKQALIDLEFIKPVAPNLYDLNKFSIPDLFQIIKEKPQMKIQ